MSARCSHRRGFHPSWSCKRVGLRETLGKNSSARMAIKSKSFSSGFGTVKPARIFGMLQFGSMATAQFLVVSRSICWIGVGKHTVTQPIQPLKRPYFTCLSREVIVRFSRAHNRTGACHKSASIRRLCRRHLIQTSRWRDRVGVRHR